MREYYNLHQQINDTSIEASNNQAYINGSTTHQYNIRAQANSLPWGGDGEEQKTWGREAMLGSWVGDVEPLQVAIAAAAASHYWRRRQSWVSPRSLVSGVVERVWERIIRVSVMGYWACSGLCSVASMCPRRVARMSRPHLHFFFS